MRCAAVKRNGHRTTSFWQEGHLPIMGLRGMSLEADLCAAAARNNAIW
jgi:hypothetical protein